MTSGYDAAADSEFDLALDAEGVRSAASRGSFIIAVAQIIKTAMMFASQLALARILSPQDFGLVAMIGPVIAFALILNNLGLGEALVQRDAIDQDRVATVFWGSLGLSLALAAAMAALSPAIALFYGDGAVLPLLLLATLNIPMAALGSVPTALIVRRMDFYRLQRNDIVSTLAGLVATIGLALSGLRYWSLPLGAMVSSVVSLATLWWVAGWRPSWPRTWRTAREDLSFGANLSVSNLATYVTTTADNIIIGSVNGATALGYYDRSYRLVVQPISQLLSPIAGVAVPLLSRLRVDGAQYRAGYLRLLRASLILSLPPAVFCAAFGERVVPLLLGDRWLPAAQTFGWISFGGVASGAYASLTWLFVSQDRTGPMRTAFVIAAALNLLSFGLGSRWGVEGVAAWGATVFVFVTTPLVAWSATRDGLVGPGDLARCLLPYVAAVGVALPVLIGLNAVLPASPLLWMPAGGAAMLCSLAGPVLLFPGERTELGRAVGMMAHRVRVATARFGGARA